MRQDGFGTRLVVADPRFGRVERLVLAPALSTTGAEQAIRARAAYLSRLGQAPIARVLRVERRETTLWTLGEVFNGVTLSDLLAAQEFGTLTLSDEEVLELASSVVLAAGKMHEALGGLAHGALCPAHVTLRRDGTAVFSCAVFGEVLQALQLDRDHVWREFGLVLPFSAGPPKFDRRADVAQLGAMVLAIGHRRSLRRNEVPGTLDDLVEQLALLESSQVCTRFKIWLRDALQLHGRATFASCVEAARKLGRVLASIRADEAPAFALRTAILQLCDNT